MIKYVFHHTNPFVEGSEGSGNRLVFSTYAMEGDCMILLLKKFTEYLEKESQNKTICHHRLGPEFQVTENNKFRIRFRGTFE
jgi:hypothetical protein